MERMEVMRDHDNYRKTKDELISLLHLNNRQGLNWLMKSTSLDYEFLFDFVYRDIIPKRLTIPLTIMKVKEEETKKISVNNPRHAICNQ